MRALPLLLAGVLSALASGEARACRCAQGALDPLYKAPGTSQRAALVRVKPQQAPPASPSAEAAGPGWVELETHVLRGSSFQRYRSRGTSCDVRVPSGGWFLLLSEGDPDRGFSQCNSALVRLEEAGPFLAHLLPNPAWTACRKDAECTASPGPGCLPPLPVRRDALRTVTAWGREVAQALRCGDAAAAKGPAPRPACQSGTCGFVPPSGP